MKVYDREGRLKVNAAPVSFADSANIDAFGRLRISNPIALFDSEFEYDLQPQLWNTAITGAAPPTATHNSADATVSLNLTATDEKQVVLRQSKQYIRHQPGRSHFVFMTFNLLEAAASDGVSKELGYGDDDEGVLLLQDSTGVSLLVRKGAAGTAVAQASWNLDKMDGTGPSGVTLNWTLAQILAIDLEGLGVGRVRVGFVVDGNLYYVHEFNNANALATTYMRTANLPVRYRIAKDSGGSTGELLQICSSVFSEGGLEAERMVHFSFGNGTTGISVTTRRAVLSIRPKATFGGITTRGLILPETFTLAMSAAAARVVYWELIYNPTFVTLGGALTWTSASADSMVEYSVHGDANAGAFSTGQRLYSGQVIVSPTSTVRIERQILDRLPLVLDSAGGNPIALSLVVTASGATDCYSSIDWKELR